MEPKMDRFEESEEVQEREFYGESAETEAAASERRSFGHLWLISYSDFMTILMIFFLGMYGYTVLGKAALLKSKLPDQMSVEEFLKVVDQLKSKLGEGVELRNDANKMVVNLPNEILFPSGQATLTTGVRSTLEEFGISLKLMEGAIVVEGHTDNVPIHSRT